MRRTIPTHSQSRQTEWEHRNATSAANSPSACGWHTLFCTCVPSAAASLVFLGHVLGCVVNTAVTSSDPGGPGSLRKLCSPCAPQETTASVSSHAGPCHPGAQAPQGHRAVGSLAGTTGSRSTGLWAIFIAGGRQGTPSHGSS